VILQIRLLAALQGTLEREELQREANPLQYPAGTPYPLALLSFAPLPEPGNPAAVEPDRPGLLVEDQPPLADSPSLQAGLMP
jgi:hypothetical protein